MAKRKMCIRVAIFKHQVTEQGPDFGGLLVEQLRYAGIVTVHERAQSDTVPHFFDIHAPKSVSDTDLWAKMNAERMQSFGINAVAAPEWEANQPDPTTVDIKA